MRRLVLPCLLLTLLFIVAVAYAQPYVEVLSLYLSAEQGVVTPGTPVKLHVRAVVKPPSADVELEVKITCMLQPESKIITAYAYMSIPRGAQEAETTAQVVLPYVGTWSCVASSRGVTSNTVYISVVSSYTAMMTVLSKVLIILALVAVLVIVLLVVRTVMRRRAEILIK